MRKCPYVGPRAPGRAGPIVPHTPVATDGMAAPRAIDGMAARHAPPTGAAKRKKGYQPCRNHAKILGNAVIDLLNGRLSQDCHKIGGRNRLDMALDGLAKPLLDCRMDASRMPCPLSAVRNQNTMRQSAYARDPSVFARPVSPPRLG